MKARVVNEGNDESALQSCNSSTFRQLQSIYLIGFILLAAGVHLQSAYRYALLQSYGISRATIELLSVESYGSSLVVGTFVASLADRFGRRQSCLLCGLFQILNYLSYHFRNVWILSIGHLFWGLALALSHSAFEAWLIQEHHERDLNAQSLKRILRDANISLNLVTMLTGLLSQLLVQSFSYITPFDVGIGFFVLMIIFILWKWPENYGGKNTSVATSFISAMHILRADPRIAILGMSSALFEASFYIFLIEWTPSLQAAKHLTISHPLPLGYIYAGYMLFSMIGTFLFGVLAKRFRAQSFMIIIFLVAALGLSVPIIVPNAQLAILIGFIVFQFCSGVYLPSISLLRSQYIPNEIRATLMNYLRVPELVFMIIILLFHFRLSIVFILCVSMVLLAMFCMIALRSFKLPDEEAYLGETQMLLKEPSSPLFKIKTPEVQSSDTTSLLSQASLTPEDNATVTGDEKINSRSNQ